MTQTAAGKPRRRLIKAKYKRKLVTGYKWFLLGDSYWLLLTNASIKITGLSAIPIDNLSKISRMP
jgi:hypothetical protein